MKIREGELRRLRMPLVGPFRTSFGTQTERDILLVKLTGEDSEGWGECVAMDVPLYSSEFVAGCEHVIRTWLLPLLMRQDDVQPEAVSELFVPFAGNRMAKEAVELAVLDAELKRRGQSLAAYLGSVCDRIPCGVSVGITDTTEQLLAQLEGYLAQGYQRIKLKIEPGLDVERVRAVREHFGPDLRLQVDANAAYTLEDADHLARLDDFGLILIEQPIHEEEVWAHAKLARRLRTPVCLDESILSARVARECIEIGACSIVNIKAGRVGGYLEAKRIHDVCAELGVPVWCGGMLETGIGRAANLALAGLPNFTIIGDVSASNRFWREDITEPFEMVDGHIAVPTEPGLGVTVRQEVLDRYTTSVERIRA